ncbi:MAG TPA: hypothetical protein VJ553_03665 [Candidatus Paceibacterota bacterium]|nr:hypothetical protein [Candidatus Paceibacterota bacterium]
MADVETRKTIVLPSPGDVVYLEDWGGVLGICKEYDPQKPNEITLTWPRNYADLFWPAPEQRFDRDQRIEVTVLRYPAQVLECMGKLIRCRNAEFRTHLAAMFNDVLDKPLQRP